MVLRLRSLNSRLLPFLKGDTEGFKSPLVPLFQRGRIDRGKFYETSN